MDYLRDAHELAEADAETRARRASELVTYHQEASAEFSRMRREALAELVAEDWTHKDLAKLLGMTRARIGQLLSSGPQPERALLGAGTLTIAIGGKPEGPKPTTSISTMISEESSRAYDLIAETAASFGLSAVREVIPPNGHTLRLNRPNLVVIGSPRLLPLVQQVLEADRNLGFSSGGQGWYLTERATIHRSPSDRGEPADYGYIGRLPRTDGRGTFLYLAGIHAMGTLGAATYLTDNLDSLYPRVKNRRWSVLIECRYDPDTRAIESTEPLTQLYIT
ncbi:MAG: sigma-70 family RNA polymerase sigma factor [Pseudonocardiales bacterium]